MVQLGVKTANVTVTLYAIREVRAVLTCDVKQLFYGSSVQHCEKEKNTTENLYTLVRSVIDAFHFHLQYFDYRKNINCVVQLESGIKKGTLRQGVIQGEVQIQHKPSLRFKP